MIEFKPKIFRTVNEIPQFHKRLMVLQHLGLGDHFICRGIIEEISSRVLSLYIVCKAQNHATLSSLISSLGNAFSVPVINLSDGTSEISIAYDLCHKLACDLFVIGHNSEVRQSRFDRDFFEHTSLPFQIRYLSYTNFVYPRANLAVEMLVQTLPRRFVLVQTGSSRGELPINLTGVSGYEVLVDHSLGDNMLNWMHIAHLATAIHCVPSSFYCMIDSFANSLHADLVLHENRLDFCLNPNNEFNLMKWKRIHYDTKL